MTRSPAAAGWFAGVPPEVPLSFALPRPAIRVRTGITAACVLGMPAAALLDGFGVPAPFSPFAAGWLGVAGAATLAWAAMQPGALRSRRRWETPYDSFLLALLALGFVGAIAGHGAGPAVRALGQVTAGAAAFVGLASLTRGDRSTFDHAWRGIALAAIGLGVHALWAATSGLDALRAQSLAVDARWVGTHGLARLLLLVTLAIAGRALEPGAPAAWRLCFVLGLAGLGVHLAAGGLAADTFSISRLEAPLDFSGACVTWLLAAALARGAWDTRRVRRHEAWRWRGLAAASAAFGLIGVLGEASGGEGVRALAVLAGICILAKNDAESAAGAAPGDREEPPQPLSRAA